MATAGGYRYGGHGRHNTSHYDYHPGYAVSHYMTYDCTPGRYDFHGSGHMHRYGY